MHECCYTQKSGNFCSVCGSPLESGPLWEVLRILRLKEHSLRFKAACRTTDSKDGTWKGAEFYRSQQDVKAYFEAEASKWKARGDAIAEILRGGNTNA